jgi:hypothetical protein
VGSKERVYALANARKGRTKVVYICPDAPITGAARKMIPVLIAAARRAWNPTLRVEWFELVRDTADSLYERPDYERRNLTVAMKKWINFTNEVGYMSGAFFERD